MFGKYAAGTVSEKSRRGWTTLFSFAGQAGTIAALLLAPLLSIQGLPSLQWTAALSVPPPAADPIPHVHAHQPNVPSGNLRRRGLMMPGHIPRAIENLNETDLVAVPEFPGGPGVPGATGAPDRDGVPFDVGTSTNPMPILSPPPAILKIRISHMMEGNLIHRVRRNIHRRHDRLAFREL